jgi:hypothetical protein
MVAKSAAVLDGVVKAGMVGEDDSCIVKTYLGKDRINLVIDRAGNPSLKSQEDFKAHSLVSFAHDCVLLMGVFKTAVFAEALEMTQDKQIKEWITIIGGAAGGSPVFERAMLAVFPNVFQPGYSNKGGTLEERFCRYRKNKTVFDGRLIELVSFAWSLQLLYNFYV